MFTALISTIVSITIIEILLSVDNALVNATIAESLPEAKRKRALQIGIILGAVFRVLALFVAAYIIQNDWIKIVGGVYLLYLTIEHLGKEVDESGKEIKKHTSYKRVIFEIALADIVFSLDNVISAVSFSDNLALVMLGVGVGVISMLFATPIISKLIHKYKGLSTAAYVIVGLIGLALIVETLTHIHIGEVQKFGAILAVLGFTLWYEKNSKVRRLTTPILKKMALVIGLPMDFARVTKKVIMGGSK
jgi:YkoY family integral membrane protein